MKNNYFPNKWISGVSLVLAPLLMLAGELCRIQFHFFFPDQIKAFQTYPDLIILSYSLFIAGNIALFPAIIALSNRICAKKPVLGMWGGTMAILGLFARTFHSGVDYLAFQLSNQVGVDSATDIIAKTYGAFHIFHAFSACIMFGWIVLAIGGFLSKSIAIPQCVALALMSTLPLGVLKGTTTMGIVAIAGLCIALIPFGIKLIQEGESVSRKKILLWSFVVIAVGVLFFLFGQLG